MEKIVIAPQYRLRVKQRLAVVAYALEHGLKGASRRFGLDRKTVRAWVRRWRAAGVTGLLPRHPTIRPTRLPDEVVRRIEHARRELRYGAPRTRIWLRRVHKRNVSIATIQRTFRKLGLPQLARGRARTPKPRQLTLFEKPHPGDSVQVDVKVVKIAGQKAFQYTALDNCTRLRVLRLDRRQNQVSSLECFAELRKAFPFPIRQLQNDNGSEFPLAFSLSVQEAGIQHRYIRPRRPQQNGKVERSHRIDSEEFWSRRAFPTFTAAAAALPEWERVYNFDRFSMALHGLTLAEKLATRFPAETAS